MPSPSRRWNLGQIGIAAALLLGIMLRVFNPVPSTRSNDELAYSLYAGVVASEGPGAIRALVARHLDDPARAGLPPPTRIGYILPAAMVVKILGLKLEFSLQVLSTASSIALLLILAW